MKIEIKIKAHAAYFVFEYDNFVSVNVLVLIGGTLHCKHC